MDSNFRVRGLALLAVVATFLVADIGLTVKLTALQPLGIDFAPIWTGVRMSLEQPAAMYDFAAVTREQAQFLGSFGKVRPFVYPPTVAVLFLPFALVDVRIAYVAFTLATGALLLWSTWRLSHRPVALLLLIALPPVWLSALVGQVTFLIAGLTLTALSLRDRPLLAGVLLGLAATVKPQLLVLFPLALARDGRWCMLVAALGTGGVVCGVSLVMLGVAPWQDWLAALPRFSLLVSDDPRLMAGVITPIGALVRHGVEGPTLLASQAVFAAAGASLVWWCFGRKASPAHQLAALFGGSLLLAPYAMSYELAVLAPVAAVLAARLEAPRWPIHLGALALLNLAVPGFVCLIGFLILVLHPLCRAQSDVVGCPTSS